MAVHTVMNVSLIIKIFFLYLLIQMVAIVVCHLGISLTSEQWEKLKSYIPEIDEDIKSQ